MSFHAFFFFSMDVHFFLFSRNRGELLAIGCVNTPANIRVEPVMTYTPPEKSRESEFPPTGFMNQDAVFPKCMLIFGFYDNTPLRRETARITPPTYLPPERI